MSIEQKARAYDEALEKARAMYGGIPTDSAMLEEIFPELAESEDERIRKGLIEALKKSKTVGELKFILPEPTREECIAYLEKQKYDRMQPVYDNLDSFESALAKAWKAYNDSGSRTVDGCEDDYVECAHAKGFREGYLFGIEKRKENPKSADSIPSDCMSDAKCEDRWHKVGDSLPDNPREVLCKDEAGNYFIGRYYVGEGWEISNYDDEDKPHHLNPPVSKWIDFPSEKQKEPHYTKRNALFDKCVENCNPAVMKEVSDKIDEMLEKEQKSADQGVKGRRGRIGSTPEHIRKKAENFLSKMEPPYDADDICSAYETGAMESIKQEWSEEDEDMLNSCISSIEEAKENRYAYKETDGDTSYDHEIAWLKSLRNRGTNCTLLWKPSEKQMKALEDAFRKDGSDEYRKTINSLYQQLKKL